VIHQGGAGRATYKTAAAGLGPLDPLRESSAKRAWFLGSRTTTRPYGRMAGTR
jgi:hypothetical protein